MAVKIDYVLFADNGIIEAGSGKVSLIGMFQSIHMDPKVPVIPTMCIYCAVTVDAEPDSLRLEIVSKTGEKERKLYETPLHKPIKKMGGPVEQSGSPGILMIQMGGLPITGDTLEFYIYDNEILLKKESLPVLKIGEQADVSN